MISTKINRAFVVLGLALTGWNINPVIAQDKKAISGRQAAGETLALDPAVRMGKLPNGFTYYIRHNEEPKDRVIMYLVNKAGSVLESDDQRGLAHFMEHMSFNGTKHFPKNELVGYLQKSGIRFGADLNAYTSFDETVYQLPLPADKSEILKNGLQIMCDWAQDATLDPVEIDKERGVVLEEKRLGKGAAERMQRQYWPTLLNNSRYSVRMPIGTDEVLNNFKPEAIKRFYKDWYRPDLQALIIVGDIDVKEMEANIKAKFGDLKNPAGEKLRIQYHVPLTGNNQFLVVTDKEMPVTVAEVLIKHPSLPLHTASDYRASIIRELFNQMLQNRYNELTHQANPPFAQGGASASDFLGGIATYDLSLVAKPKELESGFKAAWRETERVKRFGFTTTELVRAKMAYHSQVENALKETHKTNSEQYVKEYQQYFLKGIASPGIEKEYALTNDELPGITLAEVNELAKAQITDKNRDILVLAPENDKTGLPDEQTFLSWIKSVQQENIQPFKDEVSTLPLLSKNPIPGKVVSETRDTLSGVTTVKLGNGVTVLLKPTNFKDNEIYFTGFSNGGTSLYSDADFQSAVNAGNIISSFGAGNYSVTELDKFLTGKELGVQPFIDERSQGVRGGATPKDLETALSLLHAYITEPRKDKNLFESFINRSKAGLVNRGNDPASVFKDTVSAVMGNHNIRYTGPSIEKLNQVEPDKSYRIYKERFADASGFVFTFVGSFDVAAIKPLLEKYLGSLPATGTSQAAKDLGITTPKGKIEKNIYKGTEPKATVELIWSGDFNYTQKDKVALDALKECLQIRLIERLREDESGVYSPYAFESSAKWPDANYKLGIYFGCGPQNVDKLIASAQDEINKLKAQGPPALNVDKWKAEALRVNESALTSNQWWLNYLNGQNINRENIGSYKNYVTDVNPITPAMVQEAAKKYLLGINYIRFVMLPESSRPAK
ncbi:MAG: insulinase family protein [Mucilaginibacter sp.]|nr:insulinase family protein [Mucilaginibacter sp.]